MGDFGDAAKRVGRLRDNLEDEHNRATKNGMELIRQELRKALRLADPRPSVARGVLVNNILLFGRALRGRGQRLSLPYWARYVEDGTGSGSPHKAPANPPYAAILEWAQAKPIIPEKYETIEDAAMAIAQSIADDGTAPHPFIEPVWEGGSATELLIERNERAMSRALRRSF